MPSLDDLRELGYTAEVASGSVEVEQAALDAARELATPDRIESDVQEIADKAALDATALAVQRGITAAKIPGAVSEAVARITALALDHITVARSEQVAFHERALEIAQNMPTTYVVSGPGVQTLYLSFEDATGEPTANSLEVFETLVDEDAHRERLFQHRLRHHPKAEEIWQYVRTLRGKGWTVKAELQEDGTGLQARITAAGHSETVASTLAQLRSAANNLADLTD